MIMIFLLELVGQSYHIRYKPEMVEADVGEKDRPLARAEISEGEREWLERLVAMTILEGWELILWLWMEWLISGKQRSWLGLEWVLSE